MKNRLSWVVVPGVALLMACSVEQGRSSRNPASVDLPEVEAAAATVSASQLCTQGYWKNHPEAWPEEGITIGAVEYTTDEAIEILSTPSRGDATLILAHQLIAAELNLLAGAEDTAAATIAAAHDWLELNPVGSNPASPAREEGIGYAEVLDEYNNGATEDVPCEASSPPSEPPEPS